MKIKAKESYEKLDDTKNFNSLLSASTHLKLVAGLVVDYKGDIPDELKKHLTEIKATKGSK